MWARTNIGASVVPQYLQRGGSAFSGAFFSDIETNEKPIPIRRQAVPDRPRRHIQKRMKFRFELTILTPSQWLNEHMLLHIYNLAIWFSVLAVIIMCNWTIERRGVLSAALR